MTELIWPRSKCYLGGCERPPIPGSGYCAEHREAVAEAFRREDVRAAFKRVRDAVVKWAYANTQGSIGSESWEALDNVLREALEGA